jgi:hypothetical protein
MKNSSASTVQFRPGFGEQLCIMRSHSTGASENRSEAIGSASTRLARSSPGAPPTTSGQSERGQADIQGENEEEEEAGDKES